jgi:hypothetical protein
VQPGLASRVAAAALGLFGGPSQVGAGSQLAARAPAAAGDAGGAEMEEAEEEATDADGVARPAADIPPPKKPATASNERQRVRLNEGPIGSALDVALSEWVRFAALPNKSGARAPRRARRRQRICASASRACAALSSASSRAARRLRARGALVLQSDRVLRCR